MLSGHAGSVYALENGFSSGTFLSGSSDKLVVEWNLAESSSRVLAKFPAPVYALLALQEKQLLLAGTGAGSVHVIDVAEKAETKILQLHKAQVFDLAVSKKHRLLFSAGGDGQLCVFSLENFDFIRAKVLCKEKVRGLAVSPDEALLAVASGDGNVRIFSLPEMEERFVFHAHDLSANCVAWHPNGKLLLSGGRDAYLRAWETENNFAKHSEVAAHNYAIYRIVFQPGGTLFATASRDKTVKLWDAASLQFLLRINKENFDGHVNSVNALLWKDEGLISAGDDRSVMVWGTPGL